MLFGIAPGVLEVRDALPFPLLNPSPLLFPPEPPSPLVPGKLRGPASCRAGSQTADASSRRQARADAKWICATCAGPHRTRDCPMASGGDPLQMGMLMGMMAAGGPMGMPPWGMAPPMLPPSSKDERMRRISWVRLALFVFLRGSITGSEVWLEVGSGGTKIWSRSVPQSSTLNENQRHRHHVLQHTSRISRHEAATSRPENLGAMPHQVEGPSSQCSPTSIHCGLPIATWQVRAHRQEPSQPEIRRVVQVPPRHVFTGPVGSWATPRREASSALTKSLSLAFFVVASAWKCDPAHAPSGGPP